MTVRFVDVIYFLAEIGVYVAVAWWGFSRDLSGPARWALGILVIAVFAVSWALFAAPTAPMPLSGAANVVFRLVWFGIGLAAAVVVVTGFRFGASGR